MLKRSIISCGVLFALPAGTALAQVTPTVDSLQRTAKAYAGLDWPGTYLRLCVPGQVPLASRPVPTVNPANYPDPALPDLPDGNPPKANWYSPPAKIGDNLYFLGTRNHNTYALVSKKGEIILLDGNFDYATEAEIHEGLRILGLDKRKVRYLLIAHAHGDHDGGAHLTEAAIRGVTIVYGEGDWPGVLARTVPHATRFGPQNDGTDGRVIRVGDVSVQIVTMPGHTPGTLSFLFEFKDQGQRIRAAYSGGTAISFTSTNPAVYDQYIASARKFAQAAADYGATVMFSNHTEFDNAYFRAHTAARRAEGDDKNRHGKHHDDDDDDDDGGGRGHGKTDSVWNDVPNPYFVGQRRVLNYTAVVELCAMAAKLRAGHPL
jgi:metallo-beta-lactamase class B